MQIPNQLGRSLQGSLLLAHRGAKSATGSRWHSLGRSTCPVVPLGSKLGGAGGSQPWAGAGCRAHAGRCFSSPKRPWVRVAMNCLRA